MPLTSLSLPRPLPEPIEKDVIGGRGRRLGGPVEQEIAQALPILVKADQLPNIFAAGSVPAFGDLLVDEGFERIRKRDVHRAHGRNVGLMAKFGKAPVSDGSAILSFLGGAEQGVPEYGFKEE